MTPEVIEAWAMVAFAIMGPPSLAFALYSLFKHG